MKHPFDTCYHRGTTFRLKWFLKDLKHSLTQNRRKLTVRFARFSSCTSALDLFHAVAVLVFSKLLFARGLKLQNRGNLGKLLVHLYCITRALLFRPIAADACPLIYMICRPYVAWLRYVEADWPRNRLSSHNNIVSPGAGA